MRGSQCTAGVVCGLIFIKIVGSNKMIEGKKPEKKKKFNPLLQLGTAAKLYAVACL